VRAAWPFARAGLRVVVGGVFVLAGLGKLSDAEAVPALIRFVRDCEIPLFGHVSEWVVHLPVAELTVGVLLACGLFSRFHGSAAAALLALFVTVLAVAWGHGMDLASCSCFGAADSRPTYGAVIGRDIALLLACVPIIAWGPGRLSLDGMLARAEPSRTLRPAQFALTAAPLVLLVGILWFAHGASDREVDRNPRGRIPVSGRVVDGSNRGVPDCEFRNSDGELLGRTRRTGAFRFEVAPEEILISVHPAPAASLRSRELRLPSMMTAEDGYELTDIVIALTGKP